MTDKNWSEADYAAEMRRIQEEIERAVAGVKETEDLFEDVPDEDFKEVVELGEDFEEEYEEAAAEEDDALFDEGKNTEEKTERKGPLFTKKRLTILAAALVSTLAVAGIAFFIYFQNKVKFYEDHFFAGTYINGVDFSDHTPEEVEEELLSRIDEYVLKIRTREGDTLELAGRAIKLTPEFDVDFQELLDQQNPKDWMKLRGETFEYETKAMWSYDEALLQSWFENEAYFDETTKIENVEMKLMWASELEAWMEEQAQKEEGSSEGVEEPVAPTEPETPQEPEGTDNGEAAEAPKADSYVVRQPVQGNRIDMEAAYEEIKKALGSLADELVLADTDCYVDEVIEMDTTKLQKAADNLNVYAKSLVIYDLGEGILEVVDIELISQCLTVDENGEVTFDTKPLENFVTYLQDTYDTYGKTRTVTTWYGGTVNVAGGTYGWQLNWQKTFDALVEYVKTGQTVTTEPIYKQKAASHGANDYGSTYVELDMNNQVVKFFVNGELQKTAYCVTGKVYSSRNLTTPRGTYSIVEMLSPKTMVGQIMEDGEPEYVTDCKYWMRVTWSGIGFHDATWQPWFGGDRYLYNGSHGCINLSYSDAKYFYNNFYIGLPVIMYGGRNAVYVPEQPEPEETTPAETTPPATEPSSETQPPTNPTNPPVTDPQPSPSETQPKPTDPPEPPSSETQPTSPSAPETQAPTPETDPTVSGEGQVAAE